MADETREFAVTIPHGTLSTAPQRTVLTMPTRIVRRIRVRFPPGPSGFVGVQLGSGGQQVIPVATGTWFVADNETFTLDVTNTIESGAWQLIGYNAGTYDHTVYVTFEVDPPQRRARTILPSSLNADELAGTTSLLG